jgi:hypothetical protein
MRREDISEKTMEYGVLARTGKELSLKREETQSGESKRVRCPPFVSRRNKAAEKTAAVQDASRSLERRNEKEKRNQLVKT